MGAAPGTASREAVLAWMRETGNGHSRAAQHFGLNAETVKSWAKRAPKVAAPNAPPTRPQGSGKAADGAKGGGKPPAPSPGSRARIAAALAPAMGGDIAEATAGLVAYLAYAGRSAQAYARDPDRAPLPPDMRQVANATKALTEIVRGVGDILAVPTKTTPESTSSSEALEEVRRALAERPTTTTTAAQPPPLRVVEGG